MRSALLFTAAFAAVAFGVGGANAAVFRADAARAQTGIAFAEQSGVPAAELAPLRTQLLARTQTPIAWPLTPALMNDPFADLDQRASAAWWRTRDAASVRAWNALSTLEASRGGSDWSPYLALFAQADGPRAFDQLAATWTTERQAAELVRAMLGEQSGGLVDGRPRDIVDLTSTLSDITTQASAVQLDSAPAADVLATVSQYWGLEIDAQAAGHEDLRARLQNLVDILRNRLYALNHAQDLAGDLDRLVQVASGPGVPADVMAQVRDAKALAAAPHTEAEAYAAMDKAQAATDALNTIIYKAAVAPIAMPPCLDGKPAGQLIVIHLSSQVLYAYQDGCPVQATKVTTGRAALPTPHGTFSIFYKAPTYHMISPWGLGSPFWYPPTWVANVMEFISDGTFIHSADWQPDTTYGAGSQYGPYSSHGCVHVQDGPLAQLYAWAQIGTTVRVED